MKCITQVGIWMFGLLLMLSTPVMAQSDADADPPEVSAIKKAIQEKEPAKMLEGLQIVLQKYPDLDYELVGLINKAMLAQLLKVSPEQKEKVSEYAKKATSNASFEEQYKTYLEVAEMLSDSDVLLDEAAGYARESLKLLVERRNKQVRVEQASYLLVLGRIYAKQGKMSDALKAFKEGNNLDPESSEIEIELAKIEKNANNHPAALEYLIAAVLNGGFTLTSKLRLELEDAYRKAYNKPVEELEKALDTAYEQKYPFPFNVERYKASLPRANNRVVLGELFTSSSCPPCVAADLAFDAAIRRYDRSEFIVLMYHMNAPSIDPMANPSGLLRVRYYGVDSSPAYMIDGRLGKSGGDDYRAAARIFFDSLDGKIKRRLESPAKAEIKLEAALQGSTIVVRANVKTESEAPTLKLQIALVEDLIRFSGESTIRFHPLVVRSLGGLVTDASGIAKESGYSIKPLTTNPVEAIFDLNKISASLKTASDSYEKRFEETLIEKRFAIDPKNLSIVAFVQDERTKQILQSVYLKVTSPLTIADK